MSTVAAARIIETQLATSWGATTPIAWPNVPFTPPSTGEWIKIDFLWGTGAVVAKRAVGFIGLSSVAGVLQISIFGPKGSGDGSLQSLAETTRLIWTRTRYTDFSNADVWFGVPSGPVSIFDEAWRALVVSAPFRVYTFSP